jgi:hypothetical protein
MAVDKDDSSGEKSAATTDERTMEGTLFEFEPLDMIRESYRMYRRQMERRVSICSDSITSMALLMPCS